MSAELEPEDEGETLLRQLLTFHIKARAAATRVQITDKERADMVDQLLEFHKESFEAIVVGVVDRELAD